MRFLVIAIMVWAMGTANATEFRATAALQALTMPHDWLNVSRPLTGEDLKGRIVLVDFWTFCCINCIHIMPDLKYLEETFGNKLTVIGVHSAKFLNEKDSDNIRSAILRYGLKHPVINDKDFAVWNKFGVRAWPTLVLINPQGMIKGVYSGEGHREELEADIAALVAKNKDTLNEKPLPIALEADKAVPTPLKFPGKLTYADDRKLLFVSDSGHNRIVALNLKGEIQYTIGNSMEGYHDGSFTEAQFRNPQGMAYAGGTLYVADTDNHALRAVDLEQKTVTTIAGTGVQGNGRTAKNDDALTTPLSSPWDVAFYPDNAHLAIAMAGLHQIWSYDIAKQTVSVIAGNGSETIVDGTYPDNSLAQTSGLSAKGDILYFVDAETSSLRMLQNGQVRTLIGSGLFDFGFKDGKQGIALLQHPLGLYADDSGVLIADSYNHSIRRYDFGSGMISTLIGNGKRGDLNEPNAIIEIGDKAYIADTNDNVLRVWDGKTLSTLDVMEPAGAILKQPDAQLPNLKKVPAAEVKAGALALQVMPPKGWKLNAEAPSYLALYPVKEEAPLAVWQRGQIRKHSLTTPALPKGEYVLQGTLYYCEDKPGAPCLLQSISQGVMVGNTGVTSLVVELQ